MIFHRRDAEYSLSIAEKKNKKFGESLRLPLRLCGEIHCKIDNNHK